MTLELERPLRYPDTGSGALMNKRARWLVLLGFALPGSAQLLAGNRKLGRFGLTATIVLIVLVAAGLIGFMTTRENTIAILSKPIVLLVIQIIAVLYAVLWVILGFDTLRLTRIVKVTPSWRVPIAVLSIAATVLPAAGAAWAATAIQSARGAISNIFVNDAPSVAPIDGRYNILLLGVDPGADREGMRPDSISLVSVDAKTGQSLIVGLPRELTEMPFPEDSPMHAIHPNGFCMGPNDFGPYGGCLTTGYLNALYSEVEVAADPQFAGIYDGLYPDAVKHGSSPGIEAIKDAVTGATGLEVQFYVMINMDGFSSLIDALGGVTIDVPQDIPIGGHEDPRTGEWIDGDGVIPAGVQHLNGEYALLFARVRHGLANGDYDRMEHQRLLQAAILAQMNPQNVLANINGILDSGSKAVQTDISQSMLGSFVNLALKAKNFDPVVVQFTPPDIDPEYPDYDVAHQMVADGVAAASPAPASKG